MLAIPVEKVIGKFPLIDFFDQFDDLGAIQSDGAHLLPIEGLLFLIFIDHLNLNLAVLGPDELVVEGAELNGPVGEAAGGLDLRSLILKLRLFGLFVPQLPLPHSHVVLLQVVDAAVANRGTFQTTQYGPHTITSRTSKYYNEYHSIKLAFQ
jgi:hypothetical protein